MTDGFSRKGFLSEFTSLFKKTVANQIDRKVAKSLKGPIRPPGALDEVSFLSTCTRCNRCAEVCPYGAIQRMPLTAGLHANTPYINPDTQPCRLCPDLPCISACPDKALLPVASPLQVRMGKALIDPETCMTYADKVCTQCYDACPLPEQALVIDASYHPQILDACTGCGACQQRCPTHPVGVKVLSLVAYKAHRLEEETFFGVISKEETPPKNVLE